MPVLVNEPLSILQKASEVYSFLPLIDKANLQDNSLRRLAFVAAYAFSRHYLQVGRIYKPFNPLLGETFELVTPKFRAIHEMVQHHPPTLASHCQGENYELTKTSLVTVKFTGKSIMATDPNWLIIKLKPQRKKDD